MVDGATQCIELGQDKQITIDAELHKIMRMTKGVTFKQIENCMDKSDMHQQKSQRENN